VCPLPDVGCAPTSSRSGIAWLRQVAPVDLVRYTLEALLVTQAMRTRDYDPGRTRADSVLALYLPGQAVPSPTSTEDVSLSKEDEDLVDEEVMEDRGAS